MSADASRDSGQVKSAWITAIASIIVAIISASALVVATRKANAQSTDNKILEARSQRKDKEIQDLSAEVDRLRKNHTAAGPCPPTPGTPDAASTTVAGLTFTKPVCARSGTTVACKFSITNTATERTVSVLGRAPMYRDSAALDDAGIHRDATAAEIAGVGDRYGRPKVRIPFQKTVPATIFFGDIPAGVNTFGTVTISFDVMDAGHFSVEFSDLPIS